MFCLFCEGSSLYPSSFRRFCASVSDNPVIVSMPLPVIVSLGICFDAFIMNKRNSLPRFRFFHLKIKNDRMAPFFIGRDALILMVYKCRNEKQTILHRHLQTISLIIGRICLSLKPCCSMAPDGHALTHVPQPWHNPSLIFA